jgi:hypothetical protein
MGAGVPGMNNWLFITPTAVPSPNLLQLRLELLQLFVQVCVAADCLLQGGLCCVAFSLHVSQATAGLLCTA